MSQKPNPRIGVIADTTLQRHVVCKTVESIGYHVTVSLSPDKVSDRIATDPKIDAWLVDIEDEDKWSDFIVQLFETAPAPILLGEGNAPSVNSLQFQRWERKIYAKLKDLVGSPAPPGTDLEVLHQSSIEASAERTHENSLDKRFVDKSSADKGYVEGEPAAHVWLLGASLGGPAAVKEFLEALAPGLPIAFVIAQHIDPGFQETLAKVWGRHSHYKFVEPRSGRRISHGQIMIAPLEQVMTINQFSQVTLYEEPWEGPYAPSIDQAMGLLADHFGVQTGSILFSGMGNDGAIAAAKLRDMGIEVWAQNSETCANSSMPDSARATGCVSFSGTPAELAKHLEGYIAEHYCEPMAG